MIITLESWEYEWASHVGMQRVTQHLGKNDNQNYYLNDNKQPEILANIAACCGEMAAAKALKQYWSGHVWDQRDHSKYKHLPDVEPNIEVRRIRERRIGCGTSVVRRNDVDNDRVIVVVYPQPPDYNVVEILGSIRASEAWSIGEPAHYDSKGTSRLFKLSNLHSI